MVRTAPPARPLTRECSAALTNLTLSLSGSDLSQIGRRSSAGSPTLSRGAEVRAVGRSRRGTTTRRLAHELFGRRPTKPLVRVRHQKHAGAGQTMDPISCRPARQQCAGPTPADHDQVLGMFQGPALQNPSHPARWTRSPHRSTFVFCRASNGPTETINDHLKHFRDPALGFRNLTNYITRSLLETGSFRLHLRSPNAMSWQG